MKAEVLQQRDLMLGPILWAAYSMILSILPDDKMGPPIFGGGEPAFGREWFHPWIEWIHRSWEPSRLNMNHLHVLFGEEKGTREKVNTQIKQK